jgi:hypothetical protein
MYSFPERSTKVCSHNGARKFRETDLLARSINGHAIAGISNYQGGGLDEEPANDVEITNGTRSVQGQHQHEDECYYEGGDEEKGLSDQADEDQRSYTNDEKLISRDIVFRRRGIRIGPIKAKNRPLFCKQPEEEAMNRLVDNDHYDGDEHEDEHDAENGNHQCLKIINDQLEISGERRRQ